MIYIPELKSITKKSNGIEEESVAKRSPFSYLLQSIFRGVICLSNYVSFVHFVLYLNNKSLTNYKAYLIRNPELVSGSGSGTVTGIQRREGNY